MSDFRNKINYCILLKEKLSHYIPIEAAEKVIFWFENYPLRLQIVSPRKNCYGSYHPPKIANQDHLIKINKNLTKDSFLYTLLHELAHFETQINKIKKTRIQPHGKEWKDNFKNILNNFCIKNFFSEKYLTKIQNQIQGILPITACNYYEELEEIDASKIKVQHLSIDDSFIIKNKIFTKIKNLRKNALCEEKLNQKKYLIPLELWVEKHGVF